ncbi:MAG: hypothetical protein MZV63_15575 [Marinilabiliales bacterium]|nr:hypothetical protein [Marinilabiliales bacterium]
MLAPSPSQLPPSSAAALSSRRKRQAPYVAPTPESTATPGPAAADWQNMMNLNRRANQGLVELRGRGT